MINYHPSVPQKDSVTEILSTQLGEAVVERFVSECVDIIYDVYLENCFFTAI
jgi:hypothetical protein